MFLDPTSIPNWQRASKTKSIVAKHATTLTADSRLLSQLLINTLEGKEPIAQTNMICLGVAGEAWQQTPKKLLAKYTITDIDHDGWLTCQPKPDNEVECYVVDGDLTQFYIIGHWGETLPDGTKNVQAGIVGDVICRDPADPTDVWIVRRGLFNSTYEIKG